jgi:hypothetical protein
MHDYFINIQLGQVAIEKLEAELGLTVHHENGWVFSLQNNTALTDAEIQHLNKRLSSDCAPMRIQIDAEFAQLLANADNFAEQTQNLDSSIEHVIEHITQPNTSTNVASGYLSDILDGNQRQVFAAIKDGLSSGDLNDSELHHLIQLESNGENRQRVLTFIKNRLT